MELEGSLRHLQVPPPTCTYPEPVQSSPCPAPFQFLKFHLNVILPPTPGSSKWPLSLRFRLPEVCMQLSSPLHTCYMPHPSHSFWFDHPNNIWWGVQIIELLIIQFSPFPCYIIPLRPTLLSDSLSLPSSSMWVTMFHTHTKQQDSSVCLNLYSFG